ncbi:MAG: heme o synthase [Myxococcota bacterium]|nr:heme o synthase [Myxococcota bacterium]
MAAPTVSMASGLRETLGMYYEMSRPRVLFLVIFTGLPTLIMGQQVHPSWSLAAWVILGTALSGAACSVLNAYLERDIDARMARTENRPLPAAALKPKSALRFGWFLSIVSTILLYLCGGWLPALVGAGSILFYVFVYTLGLKRRTPQNIVIGGAAGATAPLIADAAVDGVLGPAGIILFLLIFVWTPPHFWAIALFRKEEYANAELPMMPLVVGDQGTRWRSLGYTLSMIPVSLALVWPFEILRGIYATAACLSGIWFLRWNILAIRAQDYDVDYRMFRASIVYLFIVFGAMLADIMVYDWFGLL